MGSPQSSETVSIMSRRLRALTPSPTAKLSRPPCTTNLRAGFKSSHAAWKPLDSFGTEPRFISMAHNPPLPESTIRSISVPPLVRSALVVGCLLDGPLLVLQLAVTVTVFYFSRNWLKELTAIQDSKNALKPAPPGKEHPASPCHYPDQAACQAAWPFPPS